MRTRSIAALLFSLLASAALAGWLPLWFDPPRRNNPNDPAFQRSQGQLPVPLFPTPTPVCSAGADSATYGFEDGTVQAFSSTTGGGAYVALTSINNSASSSCRGSRSLCGSFAVNHAGLDRKAVFYRSVTADMSGKKLTAVVWVPSGFGTGAAHAKIWIKSTAGFVYSNGPSANLPSAGGWTALEFDLSQPPSYAAGATNTALVREIGVEYVSSNGEPDGTFSVCLDAYNIP